MGAKVVIKLDTAEIQKFLKTNAGVKDDLQHRVDAVVNRAGPGHTGAVWVGHDRQRGTVRATTYEARKKEAEDKNLTRSVDAAR